MIISGHTNRPLTPLSEANRPYAIRLSQTSSILTSFSSPLYKSMCIYLRGRSRPFLILGDVLFFFIDACIVQTFFVLSSFLISQCKILYIFINKLQNLKKYMLTKFLIIKVNYVVSRRICAIGVHIGLDGEGCVLVLIGFPGEYVLLRYVLECMEKDLFFCDFVSRRIWAIGVHIGLDGGGCVLVVIVEIVTVNWLRMRLARCMIESIDQCFPTCPSALCIDLF